MTKRKPDINAMFDVLNSEFSDKSADVQPQYYNPPQYTPSRQTLPEKEPNDEPEKESKDVPEKPEKDNVTNQKNSSFGRNFFKVLLILILAAVLAWIIFMPPGSLSELKEYVIKAIGEFKEYITNNFY